LQVILDNYMKYECQTNFTIDFFKEIYRISVEWLVNCH
jgi:hypothetical protein